jgi:CelD/BcsL family acetyltransferase involved in cellulose biosynthesis
MRSTFITERATPAAHTPLTEQPSADAASPAALEHRVYHSFANARPLKEAWDALAAVAGDLFCSFDWCAAWWRHYGRRRRLELHAFLRQGDVIGIVPLFREEHAFGPFRVRVLRIVGCDHTTTTCNLAVRSDCAPQVLTALSQALAQTPWDLIHLGLLPGYFNHTEALLQSLARIEQAGSVEHVCDPRPHTLLDLPATWEQYLQQLSSRERQNIGKENRRLGREYGLRFEDAAQCDGPMAAMRQFIELHQHQWTRKDQYGHFVDWPGSTAFHNDVATVQHAAGRLCLRRAIAGGDSLSMAYAVRFGPRMHWLLAARSMDPRWHFCFPGRVGAGDLVRTALAEQRTQIELGIGFYEYKLKLGGQMFAARSITLVRAGFWPALKVWVLRRIALLHELVGHRIWYQRVSRRCPALKLSLLPFWIRTRMWPADGQLAVLRCQALLWWWPSLVARARRRLTQVRTPGDLWELVRHQFRGRLDRRSVVYSLAAASAPVSAPPASSGFTATRHRSFYEVSPADIQALRRHSGRRAGRRLLVRPPA